MPNHRARQDREIHGKNLHQGVVHLQRRMRNSNVVMFRLRSWRASRMISFRLVTSSCRSSTTSSRCAMVVTASDTRRWASRSFTNSCWQFPGSNFTAPATRWKFASSIAVAWRNSAIRCWKVGLCPDARSRSRSRRASKNRWLKSSDVQDREKFLPRISATFGIASSPPRDCSARTSASGTCAACWRTSLSSTRWAASTTLDMSSGTTSAWHPTAATALSPCLGPQVRTLLSSVGSL
mmetsp:Transcript_29633/g.64470  ORF Transcript_29633/g.64470 Transcript_29633/m.64470 type:complete len:237 (-) Transcript_29633:1678-2388(-)